MVFTIKLLGFPVNFPIIQFYDKRMVHHFQTRFFRSFCRRRFKIDVDAGTGKAHWTCARTSCWGNLSTYTRRWNAKIWWWNSVGWCPSHLWVLCNAIMPSPLSCIPALKPCIFSIESYWIKIESTLNHFFDIFGSPKLPIRMDGIGIGSDGDFSVNGASQVLEEARQHAAAGLSPDQLRGWAVGRSMVRLGHIYTRYWMKTIYLWYKVEVSYWIKSVFFEWYIYIYNIYNIIYNIIYI